MKVNACYSGILIAAGASLDAGAVEPVGGRKCRSPCINDKSGSPALVEAEQLRGVEVAQVQLERPREELWQMRRQVARLRGRLSLSLAEGLRAQQAQKTGGGRTVSHEPQGVFNTVMRTARHPLGEKTADHGQATPAKGPAQTAPNQEFPVRDILTRQLEQRPQIAQKTMSGENSHKRRCKRFSVPPAIVQMPRVPLDSRFAVQSFKLTWRSYCSNRKSPCTSSEPC